MYAAFKSWSCVLISFLSGFLIDIDHFLDYYAHGGRSLSYRRFSDWCYSHQFVRAWLIFHCVEYILLLWSIIYFFKLREFWVSFALGFSQHMVFDIIFNAKKVKTHFFYFITLRAIKNFSMNSFRHRKAQGTTDAH